MPKIARVETSNEGTDLNISTDEESVNLIHLSDSDSNSNGDLDRKS